MSNRTRISTGGAPSDASAGASPWSRRLLLVALTLLAPVLVLIPVGSTIVNTSLADIVAIFVAAWLAWRLLAGGIRVPLAPLFCAMMMATILAEVANPAASVIQGGVSHVIVEVVKIGVCWLYFYMFVNLIATRSDLLLTIRTWLIGSVVISLLGIGGSIYFQQTGIHNMFALWYRAIGTLGNANFFSMHLALSFILAVCYWFLTRRGAFWLTLATLIYVVGMFYSASRSGLLTLGISGVALLLFCAPARLKLAAVACVGVLALALVLVPNKRELIQSNPITARYATTTISMDDPASAERAALWSIAFAAFDSSPLVGLGNGNVDSPLESHNTYLGFLSGVGIVGFLIYMTTFAVYPIQVSLGGIAVRDHRIRKAGFCLAITFLELGTSGLTGNVENFRGLWILMAVTYAFHRLYLAERADSPVSPRTAGRDYSTSDAAATA